MPRRVRVGAPVAGLFDSPANAPASLRFVIEARDDVEMGVGYLLASGDADVPANGVAVRLPTFANDLLGGDQ